MTGKNILWVDCYPTVEFEVETVRARGFDVKWVHLISDGIEELREKKYDAVVVEPIATAADREKVLSQLDSSGIKDEKTRGDAESYRRAGLVLVPIAKILRPQTPVFAYSLWGVNDGLSEVGKEYFKRVAELGVLHFYKPRVNTLVRALESLT